MLNCCNWLHLRWQFITYKTIFSLWILNIFVSFYPDIFYTSARTCDNTQIGNEDAPGNYIYNIYCFTVITNSLRIIGFPPGDDMINICKSLRVVPYRIKHKKLCMLSFINASKMLNKYFYSLWHVFVNLMRRGLTCGWIGDFCLTRRTVC